jgi:O-antigen/teichoic acid export membrane protein
MQKVTKNKTILAGFFSYSFGNVLTILAGLISFPIFTRLLSSSDYGVMSLINITITMCVGFGKCGLQQSLIRLWSTGESCEKNSNVLSTAFYGILLTSCICSTLMILIFIIFKKYIEQLNTGIMLLVLMIVILEALRSLLMNRTVATQNFVKYNIAKTLHKYLVVGLATFLLLVVEQTVQSIFKGMFLASLALVAWLFFSDSQNKVTIKGFDGTLLKTMLIFGFPLIFSEFMDLVLGFSDRYLIAYFLNTGAVGQYSAAYNFIFNIQNVFLTSINLTIAPVLVKKYNKEGQTAARLFLEESLTWYCLVASAVTLGLFSVGPGVLVLMASERYREAAPLIAPIMTGYFFYGMFAITSLDLFLQKKTLSLAYILASATLVNILTNIILLPRIGLLGSAYATLIAFLMLGLVGLGVLWRLRLFKKIIGLVPYILPAVFMYGIIQVLPDQNQWLAVGVRLAVGVAVWFCVVAIFFKKVREILCVFLTRRALLPK